jgi:hypothetical protein
MLKAALSEDESAGIAITQHWENIPVGTMTATVDARPTDLDTSPPTLQLSATDLEVTLSQLRMRLEVQINELPDLDAIVYTIVFDLPGLLEKDSSTPPKLMMNFPAVTAGDLNLTVSGGEVLLTPELVEPKIHEMYDSTPTLGHSVETGQPWLKSDGTATTVMVTTDIFDDDPGPGFRGAITVEVTGPNEIVIVMPGHIRIQGVSQTFIDSDMTLRVTVGITLDTVLGKLFVLLSAVQGADVAVLNLMGAGFYVTEATTGIKPAVATKIHGFPDPEETIPTDAEIRTLITDRILDMAPGISIPIFTPGPPGAGEIDLTTFVPTTVNQQALALQLVPRADGTPCDTPDMFAQTDGFSISVSAVEANRLKQPILDNNLGDRNVEGYDVTVNSLSGTLSDPGEHSQTDGHIWVEGEVEVHVDCWPDPDVAFWGPVFLDPSMDIDRKIIFTSRAGGFDADDPCCGDVDPADIQRLIEGEQSTPIALPQDFTDVGELTLGVNEAKIFAAGIIVHGTLLVTTSSEIYASRTRRTLYWDHDSAGG